RECINMDYITRKSLIYRTNVEYGDYTLNHVLGCSHGCKYPCYAMMLKKRFGAIKNYDDWIKPRLVRNYKEILDKELPKLYKKIDNIHLCFTTDPFMYNEPEIVKASDDILHMLAEYGIRASVLTKGVYPKSLLDLPKNFSFGITLISLDEEFRRNIEPGSAPYVKRIASLKKLKQQGFNTWVSIEPYPTPNIIEQDFIKILESIRFVDKIIFGKINYNKIATSYKDRVSFFNNLAYETKQFCEKNDIEWYIKNGTINE
ncbi:MAG: radical SAM protein, partial [bacterium]